jgi:hypothetical protein
MYIFFSGDIFSMYEKLAITKYIAKNTNIIFARWV